MKRLFDEAIHLLESGNSFALATILSSDGSTPRGAGSCMLVLGDGSIRGTVGGGALEGGVIKAAYGIMQSRQTQVINIVLDGKDENAPDVICGGKATVQITYIEAGRPESFEYFINLRVNANDGTAYIFGAGHCGEKLAHILSTVSFGTVIIDDRAEFANPERFPDADEILVPVSMDDPFADIVMGADSYIVIVTRGHIHDEIVLRGALRTDAGYIGMIGSRKKREEIYRRILSDGYTQKDIERVFSPIGMDIGAETPEEIAISIAAEMIRVRAGKRMTA